MGRNILPTGVERVPDDGEMLRTVGRVRSGTGSRRLRAVGSVLALALVLGGVQFHRSRHVVVPLLSSAVVIKANGERAAVRPGSATITVFPGTRVLQSSNPQASARAAEQRAWLAAGTIPGADGPDRALVESALLDIHTLMLSNGALVAGWPKHWRYVWPRDAAFAAVALAETGHQTDALTMLEFLQRLEPASGVFQARYLPDASGVPDHRGEQSDGTGWVLWAAQQLINHLPESDRSAALTRLLPLISKSTAAAMRLTGGPGALPPPSEDYWEIKDSKLSLGTAAPLALGLRAAADLQRRLGDPGPAAQVQQRADELAATIRTRFGSEGYPRYLGGNDPDASLAFLLPPFTPLADPAVVSAWRNAAERMRRPAGGLAPGAGWKNDGISWTPQTALFAWTAASIGDRDSAQQRLSWLSAHRTRYGALPEKVLSDGRPAGPAPLTWTDALTVLTVVALDARP
jgi:glucoamylase